MFHRRDECIRFSHELFRACDTLLRSKDPSPQQFAKISLGILYAKAGPVDDIRKAQRDMYPYIGNVANGQRLEEARTHLDKVVHQSHASHMVLAHGHRALAITHLQLRDCPPYGSMDTALQESAHASSETFMETFCIYWNLFDYCKTVERPSDPHVPFQVTPAILLLQEIVRMPDDYVPAAAEYAQALFIPALFLFRTGASIHSAARRGNLSEFQIYDNMLLDARKWAKLVDSRTAGAWALETWLHNEVARAVNMLHEQGLLD
jgi:hypothetical protein